MKVPSCRVSSSEASRRTVKRRVEVVDSVRESISGNDSTFQLAAEVNHLTREQREELLQQAQLPLVIPPNHALALKANLSIPWGKLRVLRRYSTLIALTRTITT